MGQSNRNDIVHISTHALPQAERLAYFREVFGRQLLKLDIEPEPGTPLDVDMKLQALPGLGLASGTVSPMRNRLTSALVENDDLVLVIFKQGAGTARQRGKTGAVFEGQAILTANDSPGSFVAHTRAQVVNLRFPRRTFARRLASTDASVLRPMARDNPALRLLISYTDAVAAESTQWPADLQRAAVDHLHDLAALALGATREDAERATGRGVRFARLHAIKADAAANADAPWLSLGTLAARHGVSPRYLRTLFRSEETTFTDFILNERLSRAHRLLVDPRWSDRAVSTIAFDVGFGDISHFNHRFRRKYGATPSDVRAAARRFSAP